MKDLIEAIIKGLSSYIPMLVSVVANPKINIPRLVMEPSEPLRHALVFCGISIGIAFLAQAPLLAEGQDFATVAGALFVVKLFEILLFNAALILVFRLVGGTGTFEQTLIASIYIASPIYLFLVFGQIIAMGILAGADPLIAQIWRYGGLDFASTQWADFSRANMAEAYGLMALALITFVVAITWYIYCWSIYRRLHALSRQRSLLAYLLAFVLFYCVGFLRYLAVLGLNSGELPGIN
ncbi:hypothetical protein [Sedimentitalea arenosa]|uniref:Yip1 domain-containing protein n=1 Tax=Sedimentitalea arenosa TaxID=2798803 RepID=A0A8J7LVB0_9RHOB|nr:hypothetical protein [Arenibacterium arenosum]MBJ6370815.1 hypothetical protein [Arenibacterium arenosum]